MLDLSQSKYIFVDLISFLIIIIKSNLKETAELRKKKIKKNGKEEGNYGSAKPTFSYKR